MTVQILIEMMIRPNQTIPDQWLVHSCLQLESDLIQLHKIIKDKKSLQVFGYYLVDQMFQSDINHMRPMNYYHWALFSAMLISYNFRQHRHSHRYKHDIYMFIYEIEK